MEKIMIVGVGGVGGLLAAQLVKEYGPAVSLVARGARKESLKENGLTMHGDLYGEYTVQPAAVVEDPAELPVQNVVLICVKNGGLEKVCAQIAPVVGPDTIVMPVMNGVSAGEVIREKLGKGKLLESVIYTVSSANADFSIRQKGSFTYLNIGGEDKAAAEKVSKLLNGAGVECKVSEDVQAAIWRKYVLNCAYNVATARWANNIGQLKADAKKRQDCHDLMAEATAVAAAKGVKLDPNVVDKHMATMMEKTAPGSDSSLSRDFDQGIAGEWDVFSGYMVREAARLGVAAPVTEEYFRALQAKVESFQK